MNHFTAIGIPLRSGDDASALFNAMLEDARPLDSTMDGCSYLVWESGQGSELWFHVDEETDSIRRFMPAFKGKSSLRIGVTHAVEQERPLPLENVLQGWVNPRGDDVESGDYPIVFTWLDKGLHPAMAYPQVQTFQISAFAHDLTAYPNEEAYAAASAEELTSCNENGECMNVSFAVESFIPAGMFVDEGETPEPHALFTGRVQEVSELTSPLADETFFWIRVSTYGGDYDVVASLDVIEGELKVGGVVSGSFWLCGRLLGQ